MTVSAQGQDMNGIRVHFDLTNLYYLPQYLPVVEELRRRGAACHFLVYTSMSDDPAIRDGLAERVRQDTACEVSCVDDVRQDHGVALDFYNREKPDWIIFGSRFQQRDALDPAIRTVMLYHGIGVKDTYYHPDHAEMDVRFVEGEHRERALRELFPDRNFQAVGFAKLDPFFNPDLEPPRLDLEAAGLDPERRTILYAPTFYPSSMGRLPDDWPERLGEFNLIIKPHQFAFSKRKYGGQLDKLTAWRKYPNVHIAGMTDYSILPFMAVSDMLVSEASSALFEFAALDRPIVWCDFFKLRWGHRGPLRFRLRQRMDRTIDAFRNVGAHARSPRELDRVIRDEFANPHRHATARHECTARLIGATDGQASRRIVDYLAANTKHLAETAAANA